MGSGWDFRGLFPQLMRTVVVCMFGGGCLDLERTSLLSFFIDLKIFIYLLRVFIDLKV